MFIPGLLISIATFPGVIVHEIAHRFFCDISGVPVYEVSYWNLGGGHVIHGEVEDVKSAVLISTGPLIINTLLCAILTLSATLPIFTLESELNSFTPLLLWVGLSIGMHAFPSNEDMANLQMKIEDLKYADQRNWFFYILARILSFVFMIANVLRFVWFDLIYAVLVMMIVSMFLVMSGTGIRDIDAISDTQEFELDVPGSTQPVKVSGILLKESVRTVPRLLNFNSGQAIGDKISLNNEGVVLLNEKKYEESMFRFIAALTIDPDYEIARKNLAVAQNNLGMEVAKRDRTRALLLFEKAYLNSSSEEILSNINSIILSMKLDPNKFEHRVKLAESALKRGVLSGAIVEYKLALKIKKDKKIEKRLRKLMEEYNRPIIREKPAAKIHK